MSPQSVIPRTVLATQGGLLIATGLFSLLRPDEFIKATNDSFVGDASELMTSIGLLGITLGTSYIVASSYQPIHRRALLANIPTRILAIVLFWNKSRNVAIYEAVWGVLNASAVFLA